jgi:hypothetical protein
VSSDALIITFNDPAVSSPLRIQLWMGDITPLANAFTAGEFTVAIERHTTTTEHVTGGPS